MFSSNNMSCKIDLQNIRNFYMFINLDWTTREKNVLEFWNFWSIKHLFWTKSQWLFKPVMALSLVPDNIKQMIIQKLLLVSNQFIHSLVWLWFFFNLLIFYAWITRFGKLYRNEISTTLKHQKNIFKISIWWI